MSPQGDDVLPTSTSVETYTRWAGEERIGRNTKRRALQGRASSRNAPMQRGRTPTWRELGALRPGYEAEVMKCEHPWRGVALLYKRLFVRSLPAFITDDLPIPSADPPLPSTHDISFTTAGRNSFHGTVAIKKNDAESNTFANHITQRFRFPIYRLHYRLQQRRNSCNNDFHWQCDTRVRLGESTMFRNSAGACPPLSSTLQSITLQKSRERRDDPIARFREARTFRDTD
ncbi:hypothetical protein EAG_10919 [Camponotus floridanus]|uniref:Uncharacterized protein n=1 Tax=Camponotus floridanus TaxID=104421 RepID=E2ALQ3_CAMFO|nr:hypothetical protein EAG_10919 [Camponotus floridanus]